MGQNDQHIRSDFGQSQPYAVPTMLYRTYRGRTAKEKEISPSVKFEKYLIFKNVKQTSQYRHVDIECEHNI